MVIYTRNLGMAGTHELVAEREGWWPTYEIRNKIRNALIAEDSPPVMFHTWEFAYACAMRIALRERLPYESDRTIWTDVARRGYAMPGLIRALTGGDVNALAGAMDAVWAQIGDWGAPERYTES